MVSVTLTGEQEQKLNLSAGKTATLEFPVSSGLRNVAPQEIALWYLDENSGYWLEEGSAILEDDRYIAQVSHFSFWNCDDGFEAVNLKGRILYENGVPMKRTKINLTINSLNLTASDWSDNDGNFGGIIPKDEVLTMEILDECNELIELEEIGPFSSDVDLGEVIFDRPEVGLKIEGRILNCGSMDGVNGYVEIKTGGRPIIVFTDIDGYYSETVPVCSVNVISVTAYNAKVADHKGEVVIFSMMEVLVIGDLTLDSVVVVRVDGFCPLGSYSQNRART